MKNSKQATKPAVKPAIKPAIKPAAAPPTFKLDSLNVLHAIIDRQAQLARARAEISRLCARLVADSPALPQAHLQALASLQVLIQRRHDLRAELQQLSHEAGIPISDALDNASEAPAADASLAATARGAAPLSGEAGVSSPPSSPPSTAPPQTEEPAPRRQHVKVRSRLGGHAAAPAADAAAPSPAALSASAPPTAPTAPATPPPAAPPASAAPTAPSPAAVVNDARKRELERALGKLKLGPDSVEQRRDAFSILQSLHAEVHDLDEPSLLTLDGQEREVGTLEYLCHAGLAPLALHLDLGPLWLKMTQARLRALQPRALTKVISERISETFEKLKAFSVTHSVGQLHGFQLKDRPIQGTWALDAQFNARQLAKRLAADEAPAQAPAVNIDSALYRLQSSLEVSSTPDAAIQATVEHILAHCSPQHLRLVNLIRAHLHRLQGEPRRLLEQAVKQRIADEQAGDVEAADDTSSLPEGWAWLPLTRDKRAVIIGGEVRPKQRENLERVFGFRPLKWHTTNVRRDRALSEQIRRKHIEFVIFTRFAQHQETYIIRPACQAAEVPTVRLSHGYGVRELQLLIESHFTPPAPTPEAASSAPCDP
jgi:hypothetical protein